MLNAVIMRRSCIKSPTLYRTGSDRREALLIRKAPKLPYNTYITISTVRGELQIMAQIIGSLRVAFSLVARDRQRLVGFLKIFYVAISQVDFDGLHRLL